MLTNSKPQNKENEMYEEQENRRRLSAILMQDEEKFRFFMKMLLLNKTIKSSTITHKKI